ncbi:hypothetical protein SLE2022_385550 [Rubroshorea leprosula]
MASEFSASVDYGFQLSKRIYYGKGVTPPPVPEVMTKSVPESYLPTAVMAYAAIVEPEVVDNPDVPSYQPYVHGRCDPPALIPLHMHDVCMEVDCCMDTAFIAVSGVWRVHCIMAGQSCDCRIAVPMGEQGSLLGVEINIPGTGRSYNSKWVTLEDTEETMTVPKAGDGRFLKPHLYTFKIPQVEGGYKLSIKVRWSQKLLYQDGQYHLNVPFTFPPYVIPVGKRVSKREKILVNVNSGIGTEILCQCTSHPIKELSNDVRKPSFIYEAEVKAWSSTDFNFSYAVSSGDIMGGVLLQSPSLNDLDTREMFCLYLFPGNNKTKKVFRREVVFVIDNSGSMQGTPLESVKTAVLASLSKLDPEDSFNIIAFNSETCLFPSTMERATHASISKATQWLNNLTADGDTNILIPIQQAIKLLADASDSIPLLFLITDGAVEDEREICNSMKDYMTSRVSISPCICTFGIGLYCNHYFLQMLAQIGRGHYDCAYDADSVGSRLERLFTKASSVILANITICMPENLGALELFPSHIPELSFGNPLIVSGRYKGDFPDNIKVSGQLGDLTNLVTDLKVQKAKDVPFDRVFARQQIDALTAQAWFLGSKEHEDKVAQISLRTSFPSEYTCMVLVRADSEKKGPERILLQEIFNKINQSLTKGDASNQKIIFLGSLGVGFGNLSATANNKPPGSEESKPPEAAEILVKAATNCCGRVLDRCCCMCFIQALTYVNERCYIVSSQICAGLSCAACLDCCIELCGCIN